jgi:hypothetical protein
MAILRRFSRSWSRPDRRGVPRRDGVAGAVRDGEAIGQGLSGRPSGRGRPYGIGGVATTKLVAKVASDLRKPDALVVVPPGGEARFLAPLPIGRLWGVGGQTAAALRELGVTTIGDLAALDPAHIERRFGQNGAALAARGVDPDPVADRAAAKSIGHEHTFDIDTSDPEVIERTLLAMAEGVSGRLRASGVRAATVTVKIRDSSFRTVTRRRTLPEPTDLTEPIWRTALELARPEVRGLRVRLLGVTASNLGVRDQLSCSGPTRLVGPARRSGGRDPSSLRGADVDPRPSPGTGIRPRSSGTR